MAIKTRRERLKIFENLVNGDTRNKTRMVSIDLASL